MFRKGGNPGIPSVDSISSEISQLEGKKGELSDAKAEIKAGISGLESKKGELESALFEMNDVLNRPDLPPDAHSQILERISHIQNAIQSIEQQISFLREKHGMVEQTRESLQAGISMRKGILQQIAGRQSPNFRSALNRELGAAKG